MNNLILKARQIAEIYHQGQTRRDGITPYISHVKAVVAGLPAGSGPDMVATAWLHDIPENTLLTVADLAARGIPPVVAAAVQAITKRRGEPYLAYVERVAADPIARQVKLADITANLADAPSPKQLAKYAQALARLTPPADPVLTSRHDAT